MKRLLLHIGTEKTGSTSIQRVLAANRELLASEDIHSLDATQGYVRSVKHRMEWGDAADPGWDDIAAEVDRRAGNSEMLVITNEALYRYYKRGADAFKTLRKIFAEYDVSVVVYVREQLDYVQTMLLQNQKKIERAIDFTDQALVAELLSMRQLNYHAMCRQLEEVFGVGTVSARLFDRAALTDGDVVADFFGVMGMDQIDQLVVPRSSNPSLSPTMAHVLRRRWPEVESRYRYGDLLDLALRLSANGHGGRYFLTEEQVSSFRSDYVESNALFADEYLQNADALPLKQVWTNGDGESENDLAELLFEQADRSIRLGGDWSGGLRAARQIFREGWDIESRMRRVIVTPIADDAMIRFRFPFRKKDVLRTFLELRLTGASRDGFRPIVVANGIDFGQLDVLSEPIRVPVASLEPLDEVEVHLHSTSDQREGVGFYSMELTHTD